MDAKAEEAAARAGHERSSDGRWRRVAFAVIAAALFAGAVWVLHREVRNVNWADVVAAARAMPVSRLALALGIAVASYLLKTGHDYLGLIFARKRMPYLRVAPGSLIAYIFSHNLGSLLGGVTMRYRTYARAGLSAVDIAKVVAFTSTSAVLGFLTIGSVAFTINPPDLSGTYAPSAHTLRMLGAVFLSLNLVYLIACGVVRGRIALGQWRLRLPGFRLALAQLALAATDWLVAAAVPYVLISVVVDVSFGEYVPVYLAAVAAGILTHVPGGVGVFEAVLLAGIGDETTKPALLGALVVYRVIYYLLPMAGGGVALASLEAFHSRAWWKALVKKLDLEKPVLLAGAVVPRFFAILCFAMGAMLLASGVTPTTPDRLRLLEDLLPLPLVEVSHLASSIAGTALLIIARGLQRRLDGAWLLAMVFLGLGMVAELMKGFDFEPAIALAVVILIFAPCRKHFYRRASLVHQPMTAGWIAALVLTVAASVWIAVFCYKNVQYSDEMWWRFTFNSEASRALRATMVSVVLVLCFGLRRMLSPAKQVQVATLASEGLAVNSALQHAQHANSNLALTGDKCFLIAESKQAFVMYGREQRSFIAMGDPVGADAEWPELIWAFRQMADLYNGYTVFYQVSRAGLHHYLDAGLHLLKVGEEAVVPLPEFDLKGSSRAKLRQAIAKLEKEGCAFKVLDASEVAAVAPRLHAISDEWLAAKSAREKRFSLGAFSEDYIARFPCAVITRGDTIVAFANLWSSGGKRELSVDLMRYANDAPKGVMDALFVSLMLWGKAAGYGGFNLGMAPLSGLVTRDLAPTWNKFGAMVSRYGESFYSFQGLRQFKDKFGPVWEPKYIACNAGLALPAILANVTALISGGMRATFKK